MKVGIIGSRSFKNFELMFRIIHTLHDSYGDNLLIISGGAYGTDRLAVDMALANGIETKIIKPDFSNGYNVKQYFIRNDKIIQMSDMIIALWDKKSKGTKYVIDRCKSICKPIEVIEY